MFTAAPVFGSSSSRGSCLIRAAAAAASADSFVGWAVEDGRVGSNSSSCCWLCWELMLTLVHCCMLHSSRDRVSHVHADKISLLALFSLFQSSSVRDRAINGSRDVHLPLACARPLQHSLTFPRVNCTHSRHPRFPAVQGTGIRRSGVLLLRGWRCDQV
jgi:hypothetical protein